MKIFRLTKTISIHGMEAIVKDNDNDRMNKLVVVE